MSKREIWEVVEQVGGNAQKAIGWYLVEKAREIGDTNKGFALELLTCGRELIEQSRKDDKEEDKPLFTETLHKELYES